MEAIMKKTSWTAAALLLTLTMLLSFGCSEKNSGGGGTGGIGAVQIIMPVDTLRFLPGDSASAFGWVVVKDNNGNVMPGIPVAMSLAAPFGFIEYVNTEQRDTTNAFGRVEFWFRVFNLAGDNIITATAGGRSDQKSIWVRPTNQLISRVTLNVLPNNLEVAPEAEDSVRVTVTVTDSSRNGVPGITPRLNATGGRLAPLSPTNSSGMTQTWWYSNGEFGTFTINVEIGGLSTSRDVTVNETSAYGSLRMSTSTRVIRADQCITRARLDATLKTASGVAVPNDTIYFATPGLGSVNSFAITDSAGRAIAYFCEMGIPHDAETDSALIIARYLRWGLKDTVRIHIQPRALVGSVSMTPGSFRGIAGIDSTSLTLRAFYEDGSPVSGYWVRFGSTCGRFSADSLLLYNGSPSGQIFYRFCDQVSSVSNQVQIWAQVDTVQSERLNMIVDPGPARRIRVIPTTNVIPINERLPVYAEIRDSLNNFVREGVAVVFSTTLGTLSPASPVQTNQDGVAWVELNPGTQAGQAVIKGTLGGVVADSAVVTIQSGVAASIRLNVPNPSPQVSGTGGQSWTQVIANVNDANGNPVPDGQWVVFCIIADPGGGCNINNRGRCDSSQTSAGQASVTFNAGTEAGPVQIQACTRVEGFPQPICAIVSNINIVAGPPDHITIQPSQNATDTDPSWSIPIAALVGDVYNNPVRDGIAVFFEVQPDTALILSDTVVTGNGPRIPGVAYTTLQYSSSATNQIVQITARTAGNPPVQASIFFVLPLQQPTIDLYVIPSSWHFPTQGNPCRIECRAVVQDGHEVEINGAKVIYSVQRGRLYTNCTGGVEQYFNYTGPPFFEDGFTMLCLREMATNIFPDQFTVEITGDVQVEVEGFDQAIDSQIINFRRGQGLTERGPVRGQ